MAVTRYFLGGNTASGFVSFYGQFCRGPEEFLWVIKGGPGCGKSSFMKTIGKAAEDAGLDTEYVLCSGDPDSVDGVYIPALHTGYADGTAPHVLEAVTPGAAGLYLDLGQFYDRIALQKERRAIELLQTRYRALYREAYARLAAFARPSCPLPAQEERKKRFLRAITCRGLFSAEPPAGAVQLVSGEELEALRVRENAVLYQNPLLPDETEAVYLPDEKLKIYGDLMRILTAQSMEYFSSRPPEHKQMILFCLDEFASFGKLQITEALRKLRKRHIRIMILTQSLADLDIIYGKDERSAMLGNFKFTVLLGCKGTETQEYFSKMIGDKRSLFSAENDAKSQPIIKPSDLAHLKEDLYVLCDDGAVKLKKNYYFKHSAFNTLPPVLLTSKKALAEIHESFSKIMKTNPPSKGVQ